MDRCPKPKKQNKAGLFIAEVQDTDADGEQDEQGNAAQDIDEPGPSLSSDDDEDQVNGPQYSSDNEDIICQNQFLQRTPMKAEESGRVYTSLGTRQEGGRF